ncbi:MAG: hypothetical protein ACRC5T_03725 [Cetobacterium sp.]
MSGLWLTVADLGPQWENSDFADEAVKAASYAMWGMSGRKYSGLRTVTERYVRFTPLINTRLLQESSIISSRVNRELDIIEPWVSSETRIRLRGQPVHQVHTIRNVNGSIVSPDSYFIVDHSTIQFSEGALIVPADIEISYSYGVAPPVFGKMAARRLAIEFVKLWEGDEDCALPQRVTSVTRQGVSYTILDQQDFLEELRTGLYEIDLYLKTANPDKARRPAKVFSPDIPVARRYTPKPKALILPNTLLDMTVTKSGGTLELDLTALGAEFIDTEPGWTNELVIRSWAGTRSLTLTDNVEVDSLAATLTVSYAQAQAMLGMADPGTWDLYSTNSLDETSLIASGNLILDITQA